ncbi:MAG: ribonuclease H family protein [Planctomycetota bacterium]|jgi:ribonuclease HII
MALLVGIDEAGYGPLLGPLVVSAVGLQVPEGLLRANLWEVLGKAVSAQKRGLAGRILIADSKKAYNRKKGIDPLRRSVLAGLGAWQNGAAKPETIADFLSLICPQLLERVGLYPWYQELDAHSLGHDAADISIAGGVLEKTMAEHGISISSIQSRCLDVAFYNDRVGKVKNKSRVLFTEICSLILQAFEQNADSAEPMQVIVDRQGGRTHYQRELQRMFPAASLSVIREDEKISSYEMIRLGRTMRIHFCIKADSKYLTVALASMVSKYLREVMMESLNRHFCELCQDLKPTAGYWQDGQRFMKDLSTALEAHQFDTKKLVRIL